ncbi:MAG: CAP domain-containing protein [Deltaproteobacteria bacterium]|nr:CAP domain-containing protein [Deltaproteobacteria bacterium]
MMMTRLLFVLLLSVSLLGGASGVASAAEGLPSPQDEALLALINEARQNPLGVAAAMGMDPDKILKDLPELEKILKEGLPPLTFNGNLFEAARAHTTDMLANNYYSHVSPDGRGYDARIHEAGYPAGITGESLGMLYFANFIRPGDAVRLLFEYMYRDELDPARTVTRNILDPGLKEAGVSVSTGVLRLGGVLWNVYLGTCDFGAPISGPEGELLQRINAARANPLGTAQSLGIDAAPFLAGRPELRAAFGRGLPPLTLNRSLFSASQKHVRDMLENNYYGKTSLEGRTVEDRIAASGYRFAAAGESLGITWFTDPIDRSVAVGRLFEVMFRDELEPSNARGLTILDPRMQEAGIAFGMGVLQGGEQKRGIYLAICDVGMPLPVDPAGQ